MSADGQTFLHIKDKGNNTPLGSLYVASSGDIYTLVLDNVIEGNEVDFEKVNSMGGTYIANRYSPPGAQTHQYHRSEEDDPTHPINTWDLTDMISEEARNNNHLGIGVAHSGMNDR